MYVAMTNPNNTTTLTVTTPIKRLFLFDEDCVTSWGPIDVLVVTIVASDVEDLDTPGMEKAGPASATDAVLVPVRDPIPGAD